MKKFITLVALATFFWTSFANARHLITQTYVVAVPESESVAHITFYTSTKNPFVKLDMDLSVIRNSSGEEISAPDLIRSLAQQIQYGDDSLIPRVRYQEMMKHAQQAEASAQTLFKNQGAMRVILKYDHTKKTDIEMIVMGGASNIEIERYKKFVIPTQTDEAFNYVRLLGSIYGVSLQDNSSSQR